MALDRLWIPSPNYSSRGGSAVRLIVIHTAEGARTIEDLGAFFQGDVGVSSHTGADDKRGVIAEYVTRGNKAWTAAGANPAADQMELCGFASWTRDQWLNQHRNMLLNCADWLAEEARHFGLPLNALSPSAAQSSGQGVCEHIDLGSWGGGHVDCGAGFPLDDVLRWAREGTGGQQAPPEEEDDVIYLVFDEGGAAALSFTNEQANGKHRVRLFCNRSCKVELDLRTETAQLNLGYDEGPQGLAIPSGVKCGVVRWVSKPSQGGRVALAISKSS